MTPEIVQYAATARPRMYRVMLPNPVMPGSWIIVMTEKSRWGYPWTRVTDERGGKYQEQDSDSKRYRIFYRENVQDAPQVILFRRPYGAAMIHEVRPAESHGERMK